MCLFVGNKKSFVAQKDIVVYKYVRVLDGNKYITPFQYYSVKVNTLMVADGDSGDVVKENCKKYAISGGAIHACTSSKDRNFEECICLKAIIKEGTEFWVQDDFKQIAARSLYITDEVVEENETTDFKDIYVSILKNTKKHKGGIKVGHFLLSNKTYASPLSKFDHSKAIAVVIGFNPEDGSPIHAALEKTHLSFLENYYANSCHSIIINRKDLTRDFDGYKHTYDIAKADDYNADLFKAVDYCINYSTEGTNKGDWYLGAGGEIIMLAQNLGIVNASMLLTNIGTPITFDFFWTSSQSRDKQNTWHNVCSWAVRLDDCFSNYYWNSWYYNFQVRPLLVFNNKRKRSYIKLLRNKLLKLFKKNNN